MIEQPPNKNGFFAVIAQCVLKDPPPPAQDFEHYNNGWKWEMQRWVNDKRHEKKAKLLNDKKKNTPTCAGVLIFNQDSTKIVV
eukprot:SAG31_NODE_44557_length_262_cov_0.674847_1_plen_82_part_10